MKIKTSELSGVALDWAVAKAAAVEVYRRTGGMISDGEFVLMLGDHSAVFSPSTDWSQCGPLIERFGVTIMKYDSSCLDADRANLWSAQLDGGNMDSWCADSPTPLIAACRAIVAAKLGDEVDVPEGLV